jgi:phage shock protein A
LSTLNVLKQLQEKYEKLQADYAAAKAELARLIAFQKTLNKKN